MSDFLGKAVFDKVGVPRLSRVLDVASFRQKLLSSNVANVLTPGYQRLDIDFDRELKNAVGRHETTQMKTTNPKHRTLRSTDAQPKVNEDGSGIDQNGVSGVDIEKEMAQVALNQLQFNVATTLLSKKFNGLKTAIRGRR